MKKKELEEYGFDMIEINSEDSPEADGLITRDLFIKFSITIKNNYK